jgi:CHAT domain-containing protein
LTRDAHELADLKKRGLELYTEGRYFEAIQLAQKFLTIVESRVGPNHPNVAQTLDILAYLHQTIKLYSDAEALYKRSLAIRENTFSPGHFTVTHTLINLAELYRTQGRHNDAEPLLKRSLANQEKLLGPNNPAVAASVDALALLYGAQARFADAEPLAKRSLTIRENALGLDHLDVAFSLYVLGDLYLNQQRIGEAEVLLKRATAIQEKQLGHDPSNLVLPLVGLATIYRMTRRYDEAEVLFRRVLTIQETAGGDVRGALRGLANLYSTLGRYGDAAPLYERILSIAEKSGSSQPQVATALHDLASVYINQKRYAEAESLYKRSISIRQSYFGRLHTFVVTSELSLAYLYALQGRTADALPLIKHTGALDYVALSNTQALSLRETQMLLDNDEALVVFDFELPVGWAWIVTRTGGDVVTLNISGKALSDQVAVLRTSLANERYRPFDAQLAYRIYQATFGRFADKIVSKKRLTIVTNGALTSLPLQLLVTKDPTGQSLRNVDWLVRTHALTVLPSVASLKMLRSKTAAPVAPKSMIAFADPVFSKDENAQAAATQTPKDRSTQVVGSLANFYVEGRPDLASLAKALRQLPDTANEVQEIAGALKTDKADLKLGVFASETTVKQTKLDDYRIIYFATHGLVAGEVEKFVKVKAEPALVLTIPEKPTDVDDGLLTASEVAQLKLNADWAVLSACNTAAEGNPGAEPLSGLARAFFYAGARSLVVSHWEVDSKATVQLMTGMFRATAHNPELSHAEALRASILSMIDNAHSDYDAHPRLWAPFVVVGEPAKGR